MSFKVYKTEKSVAKLWVDGVPVEEEAIKQLLRVAELPFIYKWVAGMPDIHVGRGATIGSVIPTTNAIIPAGVGVDLGCGMNAVQTSLTAKDLPDNLKNIRAAIEKAVPHGRTSKGGKGDRGAWTNPPDLVLAKWDGLEEDFQLIVDKHPKIKQSNNISHLGTLGGGNHFIELCLDENDSVWMMLHSGSRGVGNRIGSYFIVMAKEEMKRYHINLPDVNLSYLVEGTKHFDDYILAVGWAQRFARINREIMMEHALEALGDHTPQFVAGEMAVNCHHNYIARENHYGKNIWVTRKGAVRARLGDYGIIPGCFTGDTRVLMSDGMYKNIKDICYGDKIISGSGTPTKVIKVIYKGKRKTWAYLNNNFHSYTRCTPDHLHFIGDLSEMNPKESRIKALGRRGDNVYGWKPLEKFPKKLILLLPKNIEFEISETFKHIVNNKVILKPNYDIGYIFGTYIGDGTAYYSKSKGGQCAWSFGSAEQKIANKLKTALDKIFKIDTKIYPTKNTILVVVHSVDIAKMFLDFGKKHNKNIPKKFWCSNKYYMSGLLDGMLDSDGHTAAKTSKFTNTSKTAIEQYSVIHYLLCGYWPSVSVRPPTAGALKNCKLENCKESYRTTSLVLSNAILTDKYQLISLYKDIIKDNSFEEVYDLEVESKCHSFIANNAIVHNSMGAKSFIVKGKGNKESFHSCSHGAGRAMSRTEARRRFTVADHEAATKGIECRKDAEVVDETPMAYKPIELVMKAQEDLVEIVHTLRQVVCVKG